MNSICWKEKSNQCSCHDTSTAIIWHNSPVCLDNNSTFSSMSFDLPILLSIFSHLLKIPSNHCFDLICSEFAPVNIWFGQSYGAVWGKTNLPTNLDYVLIHHYLPPDARVKWQSRIDLFVLVDIHLDCFLGNSTDGSVSNDSQCTKDLFNSGWTLPDAISYCLDCASFCSCYFPLFWCIWWLLK